MNKSIDFLQNQGLSATQIDVRSVEAGRGVQSKRPIHVDLHALQKLQSVFRIGLLKRTLNAPIDPDLNCF
jgi:hypothetical protein